LDGPNLAQKILLIETSDEVFVGLFAGRKYLFPKIYFFVLISILKIFFSY